MLEGFHALKHALRFDAPCWRSSSPTTLPWSACRRARPGSVRAPARARATGGAVRLRPARAAATADRRDRAGRATRGRSRRAARRRARGAGDPARGPARPRQHGRLRARRRRGRRRRRAHHGQPRPLASRRAARRRGAALRAARRAPEEIPAEIGRPLLAIDPEGEPLAPAELPPRAVLAFGTERYGLSEELRAAPTRGSASRCAPASPA